MRHQAFVHALAECSANLPKWNALCAGFLVLRHFDEWLTAESTSTAEDAMALGRVREQINAVSESDREVRYLLDIAVDILARTKPTDVVGAVGPLLAYGSYLDQSGHQMLGRHVLSIVTDVLDANAELDDLASVVSVYLQYGRIVTRTGDYDEAERQYTRGLVLAEHIGDAELALHAKTHVGIVWTVRGYTQEAEALLGPIIDTARQYQFVAIEARALHLRGCARMYRRNYLSAIADLSAAYTKSHTRSFREMILSDLAACTGCLGLWDAAGALYEQVVQTARNRVARGLALTNLLEAAVMQNDQEKYQVVLRELHTQYAGLLPHDIAMYAEYYTALGIEHFQSVSDAVPVYRTVMAKAGELGIVRLVSQIQGHLDLLLSKRQVIS